MKLNDIGTPRQQQLLREQPDAAGRSNIAAALLARLVDPLVQQRSLDRELVVDPEPFNVDEGALALTEDEVLERRNGEALLLPSPRGHRRSINRTP